MLDKRKIQKRDSLGRRINRISKPEQKRILKLYLANMTIPEIAKATNHKNITIESWIGRLTAESADPQLMTHDKIRHHEMLRKLLSEFKSHLVDESAQPEGYNLLFPSSFQSRHAELGIHKMGNLCWEIKKDRAVEVWFQIENNILFLSLEQHMPHIWKEYQNLKKLLADAIQSLVVENKKNVYAKGALQSAYNIAFEIEEALAKVIIPGKCSYCPD